MLAIRTANQIIHGVHKRNIDTNFGGDLHRFKTEALGGFNKSPAPWKKWTNFGFEAPDLPADMNDARFLRAASLDPQVIAIEDKIIQDAVTETFTAGNHPSDHVFYTVTGGTLGLPGTKQAEEITAITTADMFSETVINHMTDENMGAIYIAEFEEIRRDILNKTIGGTAFKHPRINGRVSDPRYRDWARSSTNVIVTAITASVLAQGGHAVMDWAAQSAYPEQTGHMKALCRNRNINMTSILAAATCPPEQMLEEAHAYGQTTGQWMPPSQILGTMKAFATNFRATAEAADEVLLFDTGKRGEPKLIASKHVGEKDMKIHDAGAYMAFLEQRLINPNANNMSEIMPPSGSHMAPSF